MDGMEAPARSLAVEGHTLGHCLQHFQQCQLAFFPGELKETVLRRVDHQQVFYSKVPNKGLPPPQFFL